MNMILDAGIAVYIALLVALVVWIGVFLYLWRLDAQARELCRKLDSMPEPKAADLPKATLRAQDGEHQSTTTSQSIEKAVTTPD